MFLKKSVVIFEAEGGSDKGLNGHRKDSVPIIDCLKAKGWDGQILFYRDSWKDDLFNYVKDNFDGYVSRINPGNIPGGQKQYFDFLRRLSDAGLVGMPHPDAMINFGAKNSLVKLATTPLVPEDTYAYYDVQQFHKTFPKSLSYGQRVLKQNRGSTGEGIWRVQILDKIEYKPGDSIPLDTKIKCTEAVDNHVEEHKLKDFMKFCEQYIIGQNGMLVDMRFLPRIKEGEIRVLMVGGDPIFVVHKKPAEGADAFSATLFSGAKYTYESPEKWKELVDKFKQSLPMISEKLGGFDIPLIWTGDFILDWDQNKKDIYLLGEINCSCVGFTSDLDKGIQEKVADEIIRLVDKSKSCQLI